MGPILLLAGAALAQATGEGAGDLETHVAAAKLDLRRGWLPDAEAEIAAALRLPGAADDFELWALGAQIALENLDVATAKARARRCGEIAPDQDRRDLADALVYRLESAFGYVDVSTTQPGVWSRLQIEPLTSILDPEDKRFAADAALRWRDRTDLPVTLALPVGTWLINGQTVEVSPDQTTGLELPLRLTGTGALAALQVTRLELSSGVGQWVGARVADLYPVSRTQIGLTQPVGWLLLGLSAELDVQPWGAADHRVRTTPLGWGALGRVGGEVFLGGPLAVRPDLTLRWAQIPGIALACDDGATWSCSWDGPGEGPQHHAYAPARAWIPGAELLVEYREAGRTTALGTGVKLTVERAFGAIPASGTATAADGATYPWASSDTRFGAWGLGMMANVGVVF